MGKVLPHGSPRTVAIFGAQGGQDLLMVFKPVLAVPGIKDAVVQFGPHRALVPFAPQLIDHVHQYRILRCFSNQPVKKLIAGLPAAARVELGEDEDDHPAM